MSSKFAPSTKLTKKPTVCKAGPFVTCKPLELPLGHLPKTAPCWLWCYAKWTDEYAGDQLHISSAFKLPLISASPWWRGDNTLAYPKLRVSVRYVGPQIYYKITMTLMREPMTFEYAVWNHVPANPSLPFKLTPAPLIEMQGKIFKQVTVYG